MLRPRLKEGTGYVLNGGGICMELLTPSEWSPATSINALVMSVRAMLLVGNARLKTTSRNAKEHDYSYEEVSESFSETATHACLQLPHLILTRTATSSRVGGRREKILHTLFECTRRMDGRAIPCLRTLECNWTRRKVAQRRQRKLNARGPSPVAPALSEMLAQSREMLAQSRQATT